MDTLERKSTRNEGGLMSAQPLNLYQKLHAIMTEADYIQKDKRNESQKYNYASEAAIKEKLHGLLVKYGVLFIPSTNEIRHEVFTLHNDTKEGTKTRDVLLTTVKGAARFVDVATKDELLVGIVGSGSDSNDKGTYKAITGALKYALTGSFLIPTGDDPENEEKASRTSNVPRIEEDIPIKPNGTHLLKPEEDRITAEQAGKWAARFRNALPEDMQSKSDAVLHDWLGQKMYLDEHGNPSKRAVAKADFERVGKESIAFAKSFHPKLEEAPF